MTTTTTTQPGPPSLAFVLDGYHAEGLPLAIGTAYHHSATINENTVWTIEVVCPLPHCGRVHRHGGGVGDETVPLLQYGGSRAVHCEFVDEFSQYAIGVLEVEMEPRRRET